MRSKVLDIQSAAQEIYLMPVQFNSVHHEAPMRLAETSMPGKTSMSSNGRLACLRIKPTTLRSDRSSLGAYCYANAGSSSLHPDVQSGQSMVNATQRCGVENHSFRHMRLALGRREPRGKTPSLCRNILPQGVGAVEREEDSALTGETSEGLDQ
ncbi:hypothetical protein A1Q2_00028 [Trichosporon asahii var. asahii CBS 8904]|uniref:Uncharacterized protein n=1 Tax=Trichosporon asahii var. asahii (strain CBS 8904) TaxID=1220162 RepID=K1W1N0_TRIAC|nr:hypothetical protein A1Q2_00028 [Trichosporon asahii var. asahii CBS 8904]